MTFQHLSASFGGAIEVSARKDERRWSDEELKKPLGQSVIEPCHSWAMVGRVVELYDLNPRNVLLQNLH